VGALVAAVVSAAVAAAVVSMAAAVVSWRWQKTSVSLLWACF
jgi:hypothetical protein